MDLFFGGGEFDHSDAFRRGLTVPAWRKGREPTALLQFIPDRVSGETWRTDTVIGTALSTFGIAYNIDRLRDLGLSNPPTTWEELTNPVFFEQIALADPTKSGGAAKAFENIIHQKIHQTVRAAGFSDEQIALFEKSIADHERKLGRDKYKPGDLPPDIPPAYQHAIEQGWEQGLFLAQSIGANARYFTDSASKVPIDVSVGDAAVGMLIDFYGRAQSETIRGPNGEVHMNYVTPVGGSSVSCDPISLLRGAGDPAESTTDPHDNTRRQVAVRFIEFVISEEGQKLWCYKLRAPGGPAQYALRRLPIRRDFYPSTQPALQSKHEEHLKHSSDDLADPTVNPYHLAEQFVYHRRWTGSHFNVQRDLIRAMCIDSGLELRDAWDSSHTDNHAAVTTALRHLPTVTLRNLSTGADETVELNWRTAPDIPRRYDRLEYMRKWTASFRAQYRAAANPK
jgi:ABC-type Fe3+ transport system substrate-binding protein